MGLLALFVSILVQLQADGSARISERWEIDAVSGTEMYLVRRNLGDIGISDFRVSDSGMEFLDTGDWDSSLSREEKRGKCGIVRKSDGAELCWGIGDYGHHDFLATYLLSNAVKSLNDFDMLHLQLVSPGIEPVPDKVEVRIVSPFAMNEENTGIWGFGYDGSINFAEDGSVVLSPDPGFGKSSSVIALIRFPKGIFSSPSIQDRNFGDVLQKAMEGADNGSGESSGGDAFLFLFCFLSFVLLPVLIILGILLSRRSARKKVLGCKLKEVGYCRDIPFEGDILQSWLTLERLGMQRRSNVAGAMILRMIYKGLISVSKDGRDRIELAFNPHLDAGELSEPERRLYDMMKEASGSDTILQRNEFRRWSAFHPKRVSGWAESLTENGKAAAVKNGNLYGSAFTAKGKGNARNLIGLRNFLDDFTLLKERSSQEAGLWKEYLVFASLFGIAEKVSRELQEINPEAFESVFGCDVFTMTGTLRMTSDMAAAITNARISAQAAAAARSGRGGMSSFGGGGGFSGGGFGGGVR